MSQVKNFAAVWVTVVLIIGYLVLYDNVDFIYSKFVADFLALTGLGFMLASTTPVAWNAFKNGISTDRDRFIFSYWLIWTVAFWHRVWITVLGLTGSPDWLRYSAVSGIIAIGFAVASGYGGVAPLTGEIPLQRREVIIFAIAAGFSGVIAGIAIGVFIVSGWV